MNCLKSHTRISTGWHEVTVLLWNFSEDKIRFEHRTIPSASCGFYISIIVSCFLPQLSTFYLSSSQQSTTSYSCLPSKTTVYSQPQQITYWHIGPPTTTSVYLQTQEPTSHHRIILLKIPVYLTLQALISYHISLISVAII